MGMMKKATSYSGTFPNTGLPISWGQFKAEIEKRAKEIFLKRQESKTAGDTLSDWLQAEKEIKAKYRIA